MAFQDSSIGKALLGDADNEIIKAGTLAVTRGTGVLAAAVVALTALDWLPGENLSAGQRLGTAISVVAIWAIVASADAISRGIATSGAHQAHAALLGAAHVLTTPQVVALPEGLQVRVPAETGTDAEEGWTASLARLSITPEEPDSLTVEYWVTKGSQSKWVNASGVIVQ